MRIALLDVGGTMIKSALFEDGVLGKLRETPRETPLDGTKTVAQSIKILHSYCPFDAIGISMSGQIDPVRGMIRGGLDPSGGLIGTKVREPLEREFGVPVAVENDVNAAALGEAWFGAGRDQKDFLCLTYGTGVGGAIILNRQLYRGSMFSAGEFGLMTTRPELQRQQGGFPAGIYNDLASTTALVRLASAVDPTLRNGRAVFSRLEEPRLRAVVDRWIEEILLGLGNLIHIFDPSCVILGGGIMEQPWLLQELRRRLPDHIMESFRHVELRQAQNGNRAGLLGAAILARELL